MPTKQPVLLTILIETDRMRWLVGGIDFDQQTFPLLVSQDDDLTEYRSLTFDEQASFLRHRFCGAMQRGCDRLWGVKKKACQFVFLIDDNFPDAPPELTTRVAEHLAQWMTNPPVAFFSVSGASFANRPVETNLLAGEISDEHLSTLQLALPSLLDVINKTDAWEQVPPRRTT